MNWLNRILFRTEEILPNRELRAGTSINQNLKVIRYLGSGAHSDVYLCRGIRQGLCAVKILRIDSLSTDDVDRLENEARRWASLGVQPNVVTCWGLERSARLPCILVEYLESIVSLQQLIAKNKGAGTSNMWRCTLWSGAQISRALHNVWQRSSMLHRDIKPSNILITPDGTAKLTDFGLAVIVNSETEGHSGPPSGTPLYMAPELWSGDHVHSIASDVYAFGVTLFETMTGVWPYQNESTPTLQDVVHQHQHAEPENLAILSPDAPASLVSLIMKCLRKDPTLRPETFETIYRQLDLDARTHLGRTIGDVGPTSTIAEPDRLVNNAILCVEIGDTEEALRLAERAVAVAPENAKAWLARGIAFELQGNFPEAIASHDKVLILTAEPYDVMVALGNLTRIYFYLERFSDSEAMLRRGIALAERTDFFGRLDEVTQMVIELLPAEEALPLLDRIIKSYPRAAVTWNNRAILFRRKGRYSEAEHSAKRAVQLNPVYAKAWGNLANAYLVQQKFIEAEAAAHRSLEIDPKVSAGYLVLMYCYKETGNQAKAKEIIKEGASEKPNDPLIRRALEISHGW